MKEISLLFGRFVYIRFGPIRIGELGEIFSRKKFGIQVLFQEGRFFPIALALYCLRKEKWFGLSNVRDTKVKFKLTHPIRRQIVKHISGDYVYELGVMTTYSGDLPIYKQLFWGLREQDSTRLLQGNDHHFIPFKTQRKETCLKQVIDEYWQMQCLSQKSFQNSMQSYFGSWTNPPPG